MYEPRWEAESPSRVARSTPGFRSDSPAGGRASADGRWLIFADEGDWGHRLARILGEAGGECSLVYRTRAGNSPIGRETRLVIDRDEDYPRVLDSFLGSRYAGMSRCDLSLGARRGDR